MYFSDTAFRLQEHCLLRKDPCLYAGSGKKPFSCTKKTKYSPNIQLPLSSCSYLFSFQTYLFYRNKKQQNKKGKNNDEK